jgi:sirohydrochlorin ferrochelatase
LAAEHSRDGRVGVIIVDHGSRREQSNQMLDEIAAEFEKTSEYPIVEPAHMDLAKPSVAMAFDRCVARGATVIVVFPFFLLPGRHLEEDIPALVAAAAARHPDITTHISKPFSPHPLLVKVMADRISESLQ